LINNENFSSAYILKNGYVKKLLATYLAVGEIALNILSFTLRKWGLDLLPSSGGVFAIRLGSLQGREVALH
jgi:hypothetical protein